MPTDLSREELCSYQDDPWTVFAVGREDPICQVFPAEGTEGDDPFARQLLHAIIRLSELLAALRMWDLLAGYDLNEEVDAQALAELCMAHGWHGEVKLDEFIHQFRKRVLMEVM